SSPSRPCQQTHCATGRLILGFNSDMKLACGMLLLSLIPASAQFSGRLTGSVVDQSGSAVPAADVELYLAGGKKPLLTTKTSGDGLFNFIGVRPADYDLTVDAKGFVKTTLRGFSVDAARELDVPQIKLAVASVTQSVDVTADVEGVE